MALKIDYRLTAEHLLSKIRRLLELSADKILSLDQSWNPSSGAPVITVKGRYTTRGWTEWTQGFQFGSALLQFDATDEKRFLEIGRRNTIERMAPHVSHFGVHDHGFNNSSTYGNLWRLMREGRIPFNQQEQDFYELALKVSGAVQAARWTALSEAGGFIYSFNGPHSLFVDTMRSLRSLAVAHQLGHVLMGEGDRKISLLRRLVAHATTTARYSIYYGDGRDAYDVSGRTAHESIFNVNDGSYRCPGSQQGYSPFSTWTRGLAWAILGYAEELEFLATLPGHELAVASMPEGSRVTAGRRAPKGATRSSSGSRIPLTAGDRSSAASTREVFRRAALATAEHYLAECCADGIPVWDTGAPNLHRLGDYRDRRADPFNPWEPVDSSAAAIAAQGLIRLGNFLNTEGERQKGGRYRQAGLSIAATLYAEPYLATDSRHQGLLLHSVYHVPKGWDHVARGREIPNGESSMWGDYHARELALLIWREAEQLQYPTFFAPAPRLTAHHGSRTTR